MAKKSPRQRSPHASFAFSVERCTWATDSPDDNRVIERGSMTRARQLPNAATGPEHIFFKLCAEAGYY
jgi:hypothetical protein